MEENVLGGYLLFPWLSNEKPQKHAFYNQNMKMTLNRVKNTLWQHHQIFLSINWNSLCTFDVMWHYPSGCLLYILVVHDSEYQLLDEHMSLCTWLWVTGACWVCVLVHTFELLLSDCVFVELLDSDYHLPDCVFVAVHDSELRAAF
jgi:hypothetical protein